ncbi:MAG: hypothetical protein H0X34_10640 [Chthoniobacterales bacterium]|nr:hypothetical protein [Chthoniobacterales bacterium]
MNLDPENNVFDIGDQTALVCVAASPYQKMISAQLLDLNYKVHLGLFAEDVLLKLATYSYNVIVIDENFKGAVVGEDPILGEMVKRSGAMRREHFVVLLSQRFTTNDAMNAFVQSVDQIINFGDIANFKPVVRRGVAQYHALYRPFLETIKAVQAI